MSGHSKWSTIKHKKAIQDNKRGKLFTKLGKAIMVAAREGGDDLSSNFKLRLAVDKGKQFNMPKDNIDRAIKKGSGGVGGEVFSEIVYEGFGPGKLAILVEVLTDNKNRSVSEVKRVFDKSGGSLGQSGSVGFLFAKKGRIVVLKKGEADEQMLKLIDLGAEDVEKIGEGVEVLVASEKLFEIKKKIETTGFTVKEAELFYLPLNPMKLDEKAEEKVLGFLDSMDDLEDVQNVYSNLLL